jgi:hypothetical protein
LASTCPMPQIISCVILAAKVKKPTPRAPKWAKWTPNPWPKVSNMDSKPLNPQVYPPPNPPLGGKGRPKMCMNGLQKYMNFGKIRDFRLPTSVGVFLGPGWECLFHCCWPFSMQIFGAYLQPELLILLYAITSYVCCPTSSWAVKYCSNTLAQNLRLHLDLIDCSKLYFVVIALLIISHLHPH